MQVVAQMDLGLGDKVVIVTGGASNIGRAIALGFADEKANVAIFDIDEPQGRKVVSDCLERGAKSAVYIKCDVSDYEQVRNAVKQVVDKYGRIDILVNNVGWNVDQLFLEETPEKWDKVININYKGMIYCTRAVLEKMVEQKSGNIVSIGSDAGRMGEYMEGVYAGCKAAIIGLTKTLAREVGRYGIRLNVVCPGLTLPKNWEQDVGEKSLWHSKEMQERFVKPEVLEKIKKVYPLRKIGTPEDVAYAVLFLASDKCAGHITGQTLSVSGGYTMF